MKRVWLVGSILALTLFGGCDPTEPAGDGLCGLDSECGEGRICIDQVCVAAPDSGIPLDSGELSDADPFDTNPLRDGGLDMSVDMAMGMDAGFDAGYDPRGDTDGDGIADQHEGRTPTGVGEPDTDGDGVPDYLDEDSDGDGIPDAIEEGDGDTSTRPIDTDLDGTPDFRDTDSDGNGIPDMVEGTDDIDGDTRPAFRDFDNDGDSLDDAAEIGADPGSPRDSNGDGIPDYNSIDSDGDTIGDEVEGLIDTDGDGIADMADLDTDGDGISDAVEAGDADVMTPPVDTDGDGTPDFRDVDSDGDGLSDTAEVGAGTSPINTDSDGDGVSDLIEVGAGTDPLDGGDSPRTRGDFVFVVPHLADPDPARDTLQFDTVLKNADVYFLMDNTGSMGGTIAALQAGLTSTVIPDIRAQIPNAWFGIGGFDDYARSPFGGVGVRTDSVGIVHDTAFFQYQTMTSNTTTAQTAVNRYGTNWGNDGPESGVAALFALATRNALGGHARYAGNTTTPPACAAGTTGTACFRPSAVPIIVIMTDVDQHNSPTCGCGYSGVSAPSWTQMTDAMEALNARVVGISTAGGSNAFLNRLVTDTTVARGAPGPASSYVVSAPSGRGLSAAVTTAVRRAAEVPLDVSAQIADVVEAGETVDAVAAFVQHMETRTVAAPGLTCTLGLATYDRPGIDADAIDDTFRSVTPGNQVCFDIVPKMNETVMPTLVPQIFRAQITVLGDGFTPLDTRDVFFLVPPRIPEPNE